MIKKRTFVACIVAFALTPVAVVFFMYCTNFGFNQSLVLTSLVLAIFFWATDYVPQVLTSILFLATLITFGETPPVEVLNFVFSPNILLIISAYLLSQGLVNSNIADRFAAAVFGKFCFSGRSLVVAAFVLNFIFGLIIPQASSRTILLAAVFHGYLNKCKTPTADASVVLFSVFVASTFTSRFILGSDVIINYSALRFAGVAIGNLEWIKLMFLPTLLASFVILLVFTLVFKKSLAFQLDKPATDTDRKEEPVDRTTLLILLTICGLWLTEQWHGISPAYIAFAGAAVMFYYKTLQLKDLKAVNMNVILALTAQFAAGAVLANNGTAQALGAMVTRLMPPPGGLLFLPALIILIMLIHFFIGSVVTALAVLIPVLTPILLPIMSAKAATLLVLCVSSLQYVLPFHHITMMLGAAGGYYDSKKILRFAPALALTTFLITLFIFLPWWRLLGL